MDMVILAVVHFCNNFTLVASVQCGNISREFLVLQFTLKPFAIQMASLLDLLHKPYVIH